MALELGTSSVSLEKTPDGRWRVVRHGADTRSTPAVPDRHRLLGRLGAVVTAVETRLGISTTGRPAAFALLVRCGAVRSDSMYAVRAGRGPSHGFRLLATASKNGPVLRRRVRDSAAGNWLRPGVCPSVPADRTLAQQREAKQRPSSSYHRTIGVFDTRYSDGDGNRDVRDPKRVRPSTLQVMPISQP